MYTLQIRPSEAENRKLMSKHFCGIGEDKFDFSSPRVEENKNLLQVLTQNKDLSVMLKFYF